jgi:hypothetical protein
MCSYRVEAPPSLFRGVDDFVADFFRIANCSHRSAVRKLERAPPDNFDGSAFVAELFERVSANWRGCLAAREHHPSRRPPSEENWRWFEPKVHISERNESPEVTLERAAVRAALAQRRCDWSNQVPIASGLIAGGGGRRRAVDLVHQRGTDAFDFVELKVGSDNPLFATIEILQYGLVWLLSRRDRERLGYNGKPLLQASDVRLCVLAPATYYRDLNLSWLANGLAKGLAAVGQQNGGVRMSFGFKSFHLEFPWPDDAMVLAALDRAIQDFG